MTTLALSRGGAQLSRDSARERQRGAQDGPPTEPDADSACVRPRGRIVVADFTDEGFERVAAVRRAEGHEHPRSAVTMDKARAVLKGAGWELCGE